MAEISNQAKKDYPIMFIAPFFSSALSFDELVSKTPPLGLAYLAAVLERDGFSNLKIIDMLAEKISFERIGEAIAKFNPAILGLTLTTRQVKPVAEIIKITKEISPDILCVIGGVQASALPEKTLVETGADVCVFGEGELTILELARALINKGSLDSIEGIVFKKGETTQKNPPRALIKDLDALPFPARHLLLLPKEYSRDSQTALSDNETVMVTSRGCPFRCAFCDKSVFGRTHRVRSAKNVVDEVEFLVKEYGVKSIRFFDDLLTSIPERIKAICHELKERNLNIKWSCESRVNTINLELLTVMKEAGCVEMHFGIESGNQEILNLQQKDITLEQIVAAVKITNQVGIASRGYFIIGLPGDTRKTILETIKFGKSLNLKNAGIFFYVPFPGTFERKYKLEDYGEVLIKDWEDYVVFEKPVYIPKGMTEAELMKLYRRAYLEMHLNFKSIINLLKRARNISTLKSYFKAFFWSLGFKK